MGPPNKKNKKILCVDDFGVKYFSKDYADHILDSLEKHYAISKYWEGRNHLESTIYCYWNKGCVNISIPNYVEKYLDQLQHPNPKRPKYVSHFWTITAYIKRLQMAPYPDENNIIDKKSIKRTQFIICIFYIMLGRLIEKCYDQSMKCQGYNENQQGKPRKWPQCYQIIRKHTQNTVICYKASDMVLHMDSDAAYLTMLEARIFMLEIFVLAIGLHRGR